MHKITSTPFKLIFVLGSLILVGSLIVWLLSNYVPDNYNFFAPLDIQETPTFATKYKIARLKGKPLACLDVLARSDLDYAVIYDKETGASCGFSNAIQLKQSGISYGGYITLTCPALVSLIMWETNSLQPLAERIFGQKIQRVRHYGTYACRNVNNTKEGRRSEHAYANAIDIAGFRLEDGTELSVLKDWASDSKEGKFIRSARDSACNYFSTVLGPEYDDLHKDHFHFDMGSSLVCR